MLTQDDTLYCFLFFTLLGTIVLTANTMQRHSEYFMLHEPITASLLTLLTFAWCVLLFVLYKFYNAMRMNLCWRYTTVLQEEEMLILMGAMDNKIGTDKVKTDTYDSETNTAPGMYSAMFSTLRTRNDLWVNIYLVASGVFLAVFPLACLDHLSMVYFVSSMLVIGVREFLLRSNKTPICKLPDALVKVHRLTQGTEAGILCVMFAVVVLYHLLTPPTPASYIPPTQAVLVHVGSAVAPFLIWMSPAGHHYIVALETAMPIASFIALVLLYSLSPIAPYMDRLQAVQAIWAFFLIVPICFPVFIICIMHAFRRGFTLVLAAIMLVWMNVFLVLQLLPNAAHPAMLWTMVGATTSVTMAVCFLLYYRRKHIASHMIYGPATVSTVLHMPHEPSVYCIDEEDDVIHGVANDDRHATSS